jgi:hypothetical protein
MANQAQALRAYYASMTDAKLLETARNRNSFVAPARAALAEELAKRQLSAPEEPPPAPRPSALAVLFGKRRHAS